MRRRRGGRTSHASWYAAVVGAVGALTAAGRGPLTVAFSSPPAMLAVTSCAPAGISMGTGWSYPLAHLR